MHSLRLPVAGSKLDRFLKIVLKNKNLGPNVATENKDNGNSKNNNNSKNLLTYAEALRKGSENKRK